MYVTRKCAGHTVMPSVPLPQVDEYKELLKGSFDTGNPLTTNLYVGNISPKVGCVFVCVGVWCGVYGVCVCGVCVCVCMCVCVCGCVCMCVVCVCGMCLCGGCGMYVCVVYVGVYVCGVCICVWVCRVCVTCLYLFMGVHVYMSV